MGEKREDRNRLAYPTWTVSSGGARRGHLPGLACRPARLVSEPPRRILPALPVVVVVLVSARYVLRRGLPKNDGSVYLAVCGASALDESAAVPACRAFARHGDGGLAVNEEGRFRVPLAVSGGWAGSAPPCPGAGRGPTGGFVAGVDGQGRVKPGPPRRQALGQAPPARSPAVRRGAGLCRLCRRMLAF